MTSRARGATLAAAILFIAAACGGSGATPTPRVTATPSGAASSAPPGTLEPGGSSAPEGGLEGPEWALIGYSVEGQVAALPPRIHATLVLQDGKATGSSGCNTFAGTYAVDGPNLLFGQDFVLTEKACDEAATAFEAGYLELLRSVSRFGGQATGMVFVDPAGVPLLAYVPTPTGPIEGTWTVTTFQDPNGAILTPQAGTEPTLVFAPDGTVTGSGPCGQVSGTWSAEGERVKIKLEAPVATACPEDVAARSQGLVATLDASAIWTATPTQLTLRGKNLIVTLEAVRAAIAEPSPEPVAS
jgi:heat shock protein HslJ